MNKEKVFIFVDEFNSEKVNVHNEEQVDSEEVNTNSQIDNQQLNQGLV